MDPYLERFWNDVYGKLITYIADDLNEALPPRYRAALQERVVIADCGEDPEIKCFEFQTRTGNWWAPQRSALQIALSRHERKHKILD
jgi:hypothetical protein